MQKFITLFIILMGLLVLAGCAPNTTTPMPDSTGNEDKTVPLQAGVQEIGGVVLGGGDQTPEGLLGGPVTYLYQVRLDGGEEIQVTYTAFPPSPAGQAQPAPRLTFHAGVINVGDYLAARGTYDPATNTLTVVQETDFIQTYPQKP